MADPIEDDNVPVQPQTFEQALAARQARDAKRVAAGERIGEVKTIMDEQREAQINEDERRRMAGANRVDRIVQTGKGVLADIVAIPRGIGYGLAELPVAVADLGDWVEGVATGTSPDPNAPNILRQAGALLKDVTDAVTPESTHMVGHFGEPIGQFIAGWVAGGRVLKGLGWAATDGVQLTRAAVQGAIADFAVFDPHEDRLSNIVDAYPSLQNPITDFLRNSEDDSAIEGRLKNVVEGLGIGVAFDGLLKGLRVLRGVRRARAAAEVEAGAAEAVPLRERPQPEPGTDLVPTERPKADSAEQPKADGAEAPKDPITDAGDIDIEAMKKKLGITEEQITEMRARVARGELSEAEALIDFNANRIDWNKISDPEQVRRLINTVSEVFADALNSAKGGVVNMKAAGRMARSIGATPDQVLKTFESLRPEGGVPLHIQIAVGERTMLDSAQHLQAFTDLINAGKATDQDFIAYSTHIERHAAIEAMMKGNKAEVARSLRIMRELSKPTKAKYQSMAAAIAGTAGRNREALIELAGKLGKADNLADLNQLVRRSKYERVRDMLLELRYGSMLSGPVTHAVNITSNLLRGVEGVVERAVAAGIGAARRGVLRQDAEVVAVREAMEVFMGIFRGTADALRVPFKQLLQSGTARDFSSPAAIKAFLQRNADGFGSTYKAIISGESQIGNQLENVAHHQDPAWKFDPNGKGVLGRGLVHLANAIGTIGRVPGKALVAGDDLFKSIAFQQQHGALSVRRATAAADAQGLRGKSRRALIARETERLRKTPNDELHQAAVDFAEHQTFTNPLMGRFGRATQGYINRVPELRFIVPFFRTPANIVMDAIVPRTPLTAWFHKDLRGKLRKGGPEADLVLARMAIGTATMAAVWQLADAGLIRGGYARNTSDGSDNVEQYSIKIGKDWYQFHRLGPLGMLMGLVADSHTLVNASEDGGPDEDSLALVTMIAVTKNVTSQTYLLGVSQFLNAMTDPERYGKSFVDSFATTLLPAGRGLQSLAEFDDPYAREAFSVMEKIAAKIPGISNDLPPRRDFLGRPIMHEKPFISPIRVSEESTDPVDQELSRLQFRLSMPLKSIDGISLTADQYTRYLQLRGQVVEIDGRTMEETIRETIADPRWARLPESADSSVQDTKQRVINTIANRFQAQARVQLLKEDPELANRFVDEKFRQNNRQRPADFQNPFTN